MECRRTTSSGKLRRQRRKLQCPSPLRCTTIDEYPGVSSQSTYRQLLSTTPSRSPPMPDYGDEPVDVSHVDPLVQLSPLADCFPLMTPPPMPTPHQAPPPTPTPYPLPSLHTVDTASQQFCSSSAPLSMTSPPLTPLSMSSVLSTPHQWISPEGMPALTGSAAEGSDGSEHKLDEIVDDCVEQDDGENPDLSMDATAMAGGQEAKVKHSSRNARGRDHLQREQLEKHGLKAITQQICKVLKNKGALSNKTLAEAVFSEFVKVGIVSESNDNMRRNIARRVYDSLGVLEAIGVVSKVTSKGFTWVGLHERLISATQEWDGDEEKGNKLEELVKRVETLEQRTSEKRRELLSLLTPVSHFSDMFSNEAGSSRETASLADTYAVDRETHLCLDLSTLVSSATAETSEEQGLNGLTEAANSIHSTFPGQELTTNLTYSLSGRSPAVAGSCTALDLMQNRMEPMQSIPNESIATHGSFQKDCFSAISLDSFSKFSS